MRGMDADAPPGGGDSYRAGAERLRVLLDASRAISDALDDYPRLLTSITQAVAQALGESCATRLLSPDGATLPLAAYYHPDPAQHAAGVAMLGAITPRVGEGFAGDIAQRREGRVMPQLTLDEVLTVTPEAFHDTVRRYPYYSVAGAPLRCRGAVLGVLAIARHSPGRPYTADDLALLQDIADHAGLALAHGRAMDDLRRARGETERRVEERTRELAEANATLAAHERFLDSIVENIPNMVFVKDAKDLRFVRFNRAGEELLGRARADLLGRCDYDFFPKKQADFFIAKDREVLAGQGAVDIPREPIRTEAHGVRLLHTRKIPVRAPDGRAEYLLGISEDITERVRAEEALAWRTGELARSNRDLEEFAYVASHDLQEPLRKILSFSDLLAESLGAELPSDAADYLGRMRLSTRRMQSLINDLLAFSRVSLSAQRFGAVPLASAVREALADLDVRVRETGATVDVGALPEVDGDWFQLRQLFQNLLGNALKFVRPGVPPLVRVRAADVDGACEVRVSDNGPGFDVKYLDRIFKPFQRLHPAGAYEGTGIGLAICRKIVERHHGVLTAESAPGEGATFIVTLPWKHPGSEGGSA